MHGSQCGLSWMHLCVLAYIPRLLPFIGLWFLLLCINMKEQFRSYNHNQVKIDLCLVGEPLHKKSYQSLTISDVSSVAPLFTPSESRPCKEC